MTPLDWIFAILLIILLIVSIVAIIVLVLYLVKFLKAATKTMISVKELTDTAKTEVSPALKSISGILSAINKMSNTTNSNLEIIKKVITTLLGASILAYNTSKSKGGSFLSGLISGFNIFRKKGDKKCQ